MARSCRLRAESHTANLWQKTHHVIGQEKARKVLAGVFARQHLIAQGKIPQNGRGVLLAGKTGVGKTHLVRSMAHHAGLPFADVNATQFTEVGYIGLNLSQMFLPLIADAVQMVEEKKEGLTYRYEGPNAASSILNKDPHIIAEAVKLAESGVVLLDEMDKWLVTGADTTGRNVGKKLMAELLKMVEGGKVYVSDTELHLGVEFDTHRTLIICAGAFQGAPPLPSLEKAIRARLQMEDAGYTDESLWNLAIPKDFVAVGLTPELAGRLSTHIIFWPLREQHLSQILFQERGLLDEYVARFAAEGCELILTEAGIRSVAAQAIQQETGARALPFIMERICGQALFEAAKHEKSQAILDVAAAQEQNLRVIPCS